MNNPLTTAPTEHALLYNSENWGSIRDLSWRREAKIDDMLQQPNQERGLGAEPGGRLDGRVLGGIPLKGFGDLNIKSLP